MGGGGVVCGWREQERGAGGDGEQCRLWFGEHTRDRGMAEFKSDISEPPSHTTPVGIQPALAASSVLLYNILN